MAFRDYNKPGETAAIPVDALSTYLLGKGYVFGPGGLGTGIDGLVRADIDANIPDEVWHADIDAYVVPADSQRAAQNYLIGRYRVMKPMTVQQRAAITLNGNDLVALVTFFRQDV